MVDAILSILARLNFKERALDHMGVFPVNGKRVDASYQFSTVKNHRLTRDHVISFDDFSVIGNSHKNVLLKIKESVFIRRDKTVINKTDKDYYPYFTRIP